MVAMPAESADRDVDFDIISFNDVASLRQNNGITVRVPALSNHVLHSKCEPRSKKCRQSCITSSSVGEKKNYRFFVSEQLVNRSSLSNCTDTSSNHNFLLHFKIQALESLITGMTQQKLFASKRPLSPFPRCGWILNFFIVVVLLSSHFTLSDGLFSSTSKAPLTKTDATSVSYGFRQFTGQGLNTRHRKGRRQKSGLLNSRSANIPDKSLDFQTMTAIKRWGPSTSDVLLISGKDYIYMVDATATSTDGQINYLERLKWASSLESQNACQQMAKQKHECNNFIRVVELHQDDRLYVCGTNSYSPMCRFYTRNNFSPSLGSSNSLYSEEVECLRQCACPFNPATSSANLYTNTSTGFQLFSAVINDFMGKKPVLMRKENPYVYSVERWFNDPTFIKMVESDDGKVYLFFRETATAVETGNPSSTTYARVAQVCKDDMGGETVLRHQWTSFLKARLKCSISGSSRGPGFDFDNLTSVSDITTILDPYGQPTDVIFATFTTPWEWSSLSMSAVCVYYMDTIKQLFELGNFLGEQELHSGPLTSDPGFNSDIETVVKAIPVPQGDVPVPRPGTCSGKSSLTNDQTLYFAKDHFLMYDPVMPLYQQPMYVGESDIRMTQIAVDSDAGGNDQQLVLYVGTEDARILRLRPRLQISSGPKSILLEEMRIADEQNCALGSLPCGVLALYISSPPRNDRRNENLNSSLFVAFTNRLVQVPLTRCKQYRNEKCCNIDPNCGWLEDKCVIRTPQNQQELPETSDMTVIPSDCQAISSPEQDGLGNQSCSPGEAGCLVKVKKSSNSSSIKCDCSSKSPRTDVQADNPLNDDNPSETSKPQSPRSLDLQTRNKIQCSLMDAMISNLFIDRVLPSVSEEFNETYTSLQEEQRGPLLEQLQAALAMTTTLILRNHKQEYCLPLASINSMTHSYPLLLHKIDVWHEMALLEMKENVFRRACWNEDILSPCTAKVTFTDFFSPTLWGPLERLVKQFGASCDPVPLLESSTGCNTQLSILNCADDTNSACQTRKCQFTKYAVDVKAFFRHVNDSRKFLASNKVSEPLWKPTNITLSPQEQIKGHLELTVSDNPGRPDESQHFEISYNPKTEKISISFFYILVRDCRLGEGACAESNHGCNKRSEEIVSTWLRLLVAKLKSSVKSCKGQVKRFNKGNRVASSGRHQMRHRRSHFVLTDNNIRQSIPSHCRYVKFKTPKFSSGLWDQMIHRAEKRGGIYSSHNERIEFYSRDDVEHFFKNRCDMEGFDGNHVKLGRSFKKRKRITNVEVLTTQAMPFVIEKLSSANRVKLKFFSEVVREVVP